MNPNHFPHDAEPRSFWRSRCALGLLALGAVAAYFLLAEHRAHFLGALPFLLLLACPLMHVFMHHGHGAQGQHHGSRQDPDGSAPPQSPQAGERQ